MNLPTLRPLAILVSFAAITLAGCGSIESAAQDDCTSIGWQIGSKGYNECFKACVYERKLGLLTSTWRPAIPIGYLN